jgi:hypothetical protein
MTPHGLPPTVAAASGTVPEPLPRESERQLLHELEVTYARYEGLNHRIRLAEQCGRFGSVASDIERARADEVTLLAEISRLMDRMRALEGHLLRARGKLQPLAH